MRNIGFRVAYPKTFCRGDRKTGDGEVGDHDQERNIPIDFLNLIRDLETIVHEDGMLGRLVNKVGKPATNHHWNLRHRR